MTDRCVKQPDGPYGPHLYYLRYLPCLKLGPTQSKPMRTLALVSDDMEEHAKPITFGSPLQRTIAQHPRENERNCRTAMTTTIDATTVTNLKPRITSRSDVSVLDANKVSYVVAVR